MRIIKDFILGLSQNSFFRNLIKAISASMGKPSYGLRAI
jgi:hypothetical protein